MPELKPDQYVGEQIKKFSMALKRSNKFSVAERVSKFISAMEMEVINTMSRLPGQMEDEYMYDVFHRKLQSVQDKQFIIQLQGSEADKWKSYASLEVYDTLLRQAQDKINQRRRHISSLKILQERISQYLYKQLVLRLDKIKYEEMLNYKIILLNMQLGLANHELRPLVN